MGISYRHIAISGASGHIGNTLCRLAIARGYSVRALGRTKSRIERANAGLPLEYAIGNLNDTRYLENALRGVDALIHSAGLISIDGGNDGAVMATNYEGTRNIYAAAKKMGVRRFIYISSIHALDYDERSPRVDEQTPLAEQHAIIYNRSKAMAQAYLESHNDRLVSIAHPTGVIGPHDYYSSQSGEMLIKMARNTLRAVLNIGFDWVDARDVADMILRILETGGAGRYLLSGHYASIKELAKYVDMAQGTNRKRLTIPMWVAECAVPCALLIAKCAGKRPQFTRESIYHIKHSSRNIRSHRAHEEFNYTPRPLQETIADTIAWFRETGAL